MEAATSTSPAGTAIAITCVVLLGIDTEMTEQLGSALRSGDLAFDELQEVVLHIVVYLGWIVARRLDHLLVVVVDESDS